MGLLDRISREKRPDYKICVLGDPGVGKSSLIRRYSVDKYDIWYQGGKQITRKEELYVSVEKDGLPKSDVINLNIWDWLPRLTQKHSYINSKGALLVCDVTQKSTLLTLKHWKGELFKVVGEVPLVLVGNKVDLQDDLKVTKEDMKRMGDELNAPPIWTSAKTGRNVEEAFYRLAKRLI